MLIFFWFGRIVGDLIGDQKIWPLYLLGGLAAAAAFFGWSMLSGTSHYALGASGSVMAFVVAAAFLAPDYNMRLILIGNVKLKYIAFVILLLDLIGLANNINTGGHVAHLGGAFMGYVFVTSLRQGKDLSEGVNRFFDRLISLVSVNRNKPQSPKTKKKARIIQMTGSKKGKPKSDNIPNDSFQARLDEILDKISRHGYDSLTEEEEDFLKNASKQD